MQNFCLVTGPNRGIGLQIVKKLVQEGRPVIAAARKQEAADEVVAMLQRDHPGPAAAASQAVAMDQDSAASVKAAKQTLAERGLGGKIDALINNAGVKTEEWTEECFAEAMRTNFEGPLIVTAELMPLLSENSLVVMVSSSLGASSRISEDYLKRVRGAKTLEELREQNVFLPESKMKEPDRYCPSYCLSKFFLNRAVQLMAGDSELQKEKAFRVCSVNPGWCRTDMGSQRADLSAEDGANSVLVPVLRWTPELQGSFTEKDGQHRDW
uniref:Uncharacterized protein n=1 Tax=Chromera velia CCMP2878 TaxID=1169474 RepID=A0A0G4HJG1_9ALVE|mmetsp:Transcript_53468/g.104592  ORF Transcript_53468/g.104592 Transcript_53468/m.104592 type:complete len:268 (+) Transcript_53468:161-964(+)|eukprot:Cvel_7077.t1-p1 / transcript=Cvel_7077.t1 / gene=Cvel_7077 / organism=Chromera_velia_CCMP2878 / gene_product=( )-neomenthol dehydrogenase, putative / transcript_product=( )-neomenthol dehydrogenase, putative / location=Cvel_scaffold362:18196-21421(+) / protein_length=267 / sequence_SO=supercontig / SO=protein_coding / is_pseudo=false